MTIGRRIRSLLVLGLLGMATAGCEDVKGPTVGELQIIQPRTHMVPGESLDLRVLDEDGADVTRDAEWTTDDATTLVVEDGRVTGVAAGIANIAASVNGEVASARFNVRFGDVAAGEMALRVQATTVEPVRFSGFSFLVDWMGDPATADDERYDRTLLMAQASPADPLIPDSVQAPTDTVLRIAFSGRPQAGAVRLPSYELMEREDGTFVMTGGSGAAFEVRDLSTGRHELWVPVDSFDLEIDSAELPEQAGFPTGVIRGRISFEAAGLVVEYTEAGMVAVDQIGDETVRMYLEFETRIRIWPRGAANLTFTGPAAFSGWLPAFAEGYEGGLLVGTQRYQGHGTVLTATQSWIGSPGTGTFTFEEVLPAILDDAGAYTPESNWSWLSADADIHAVFEAAGALTALSRAGTFTVTEYVAATEEVFGLMRGSIDLTYAAHGPDGPTGEEVTVTGTFNIPVTPAVWQQGSVFPPHILRQQNNAHPAADGAILTGRVLRDDVVPVSGATVRVTRGGTEVTTLTTASGEFTLTGLEVDEWTFSVDVPEGYVLAPGQSASQPITLLASDTVYMQFHVADADGSGLLLVAVDKGAGGLSRLGGVPVSVYAAGTETVVAEGVTTGDMASFTGRLPIKLEPGLYDVGISVPDGYALASGHGDMIPQVAVRTGHATAIGFRVLEVP